ncbi:ABC transporter permease [Mucilaginibacter sp. PAMB04274]|uniref:ABC transporter permease n=1 Tax=Mucilaginibacter sp. PAMB04274 TaxID=3138568 RepID=UPI0031F6ACF2
MLKNYFKIAWRNLLKNKVYSFINIMGLALGMAVAMLIGLWIWDEVSFDTYHKDYKTVTRVMNTQTFNGHIGTSEAVAMPLANELRTKFPADFKHVALTSWQQEFVLKAGDKKITGKGLWAEEDLPEMFSIKMLKGDINALKDPSSALITPSLAKSLFGEADPINQTVRINNKTEVKIAGLYEDLPRNTTFREVRILLPWKKFEATENWVKSSAEQWGNHSFALFAQINNDADIDKINAKIKNIAKAHFKEGNDELQLHPMRKWHLYSEFTNGKVTGGLVRFVWLFGIIGIFVLLLACINFMNLSTARSEKRAKEVGVRKAIGSMRQQIISQFLSESILMSLLAFALSIALVMLALPLFNNLSSKEMSLPWLNPVFWLLSLTFTLITGLVSGSYPALYLSSFNPVKVLKGTFKAGRYAALPRKVLVVIQFTVSVMLIIGTIVVYRQIQHAKNRPVGYSRDGLIAVEINTPELEGHYDALREQLLATGAVENMAESSSRSTEVSSNQIGYDWKGMDPGSNPLLGTIAVTHDFGKTIGWQIIKGRDFSRAYAADSSGIILNEAATKMMGFKEPIGQTINYNGKALTVTGVIKNMIMESPYTAVQPTVFMINYGWISTITIRLKPNMPASEALGKVEAVFKRINPGSPFAYQFTDETYGRKFTAEQRIGNLATFFAILAIVISSLGLFGLASFVAEQRTKEIGVRKVLGASVYNLWNMLSKEFITLVIISCAIAIPIAWYFLNQWLQVYEYRTVISWWVFALSATGALAITLLTVSFQAIKAALANPVKSLRTE